MKNIYLILFLSVLISGCGSIQTIIPPNYTGETATITDTFKDGGYAKTRIFYVKEINGKKIYNAINATGSASYGTGMRINHRGSERKIPTQPLTIKVAATVYSAAPIIAIFNSGANYYVEGNIELTPTANASYLVKGLLSENASAVWLEDINGNIVSSIVGDISRIEKEKILTERTLSSKELESKSVDHKFINISPGESRDIIIKKFGFPSKIIEGKMNYFTLIKSDTQYIYEDLGTIYLKGKDENSLYVSKTKIKPKSINLDVDSIEKDLNITDGRELQRLARIHYKNKESRTEVLDLFMQKTWEERNSKDEHTIDALSFFCITVGSSKNPRYKEALETISKNTHSKKLMKHANNNLKKLIENKNTSQYLIKDIHL